MCKLHHCIWPVSPFQPLQLRASVLAGAYPLPGLRLPGGRKGGGKDKREQWEGDVQEGGRGERGEGRGRRKRDVVQHIAFLNILLCTPSLVPILSPLQATESWVGPGNKAISSSSPSPS